MLFHALLPTFVNTLAVLAGAGLGLWLHGRMSARFKTVLFQAIGLATAIIGIQMAIPTREVPLLALSMILGGLLGEWLNIEENLKRLGDRMQSLWGGEGSAFTEGFVYASLLFCVGAMTVVGTFQAGVQGNGDLIYTKSLMDGHVAIFLAGAMGAGVLASAGTVLVVQGLLTVLFLLCGAGFPAPVIAEIGAAGGLLIMGIAINLLEIGHVKVGNLLPSMAFIAIFVWLKLLF
ncbi:MAG: DUF554 domain-containing protein [bacterium]|jgi:uncharacterized membrane protein YqgA involved in biofilm formation|nr:DUF554 domain-containing protein [bacterium]